ncbi:fibronectin type III domain-containing protein [Runella sp.]|uniref:fibronectin type III domain-containing protein n=1 Tax=Runella sp. TaxID=1960881 RepID=UPI00260E1A9C|nr:fibronectin type III domain-containing protein [Runella sp.]
MKSFYQFFFILLVSAQRALGQYFEVNIQPESGEQFKSAVYRLWLPRNTATIRGIIVKQHGCGIGASKHGLNHANDLQWEALAQKHQMALIGTELTNYELCAQWFNLAGGSGKAFLRGLDTLAKQTNHPELTKVPLALWGHSGGGFWCTSMLFEYHERILCALPRSGGYSSMEWNPAVKQVPVMWMAGEKDIVDNQEYARALTVKSFATYRRLGALWGVAIDPKADHGNRDGRSFYVRWFDTILSLRLPDSGNIPMPLDSLKGWLGHPTTYEIRPFNEVETDRNKWVWLPTESVAQNWQEFGRTGWVTDTSAPPAPQNLSLSTGTPNGVMLKWAADIDLESGIKQFNIYRNGALAGTVPGQKSNFHDAPEPAIPLFEYVFTSLSQSDKITVTAVNHQNLESAKSKEISIKQE